MAKRKGEGPYHNNPDNLPIRRDRSVDESGNPRGGGQVSWERIQQHGITADPKDSAKIVSTGASKLPKD